MDTKVISGFSGVGKSECAKTNYEFLDSDSSEFSWLRDENGEIKTDEHGNKVQNPDFLQNYIEHIKSLIGKVPIVFISSHRVVLDALVENDIPFTLVYPERSLLDEYLQRYRQRRSLDRFVDMMSKNWNKLCDELEQQQGCQKVLLHSGQYLSDVINDISPSIKPETHL